MSDLSTFLTQYGSPDACAPLAQWLISLVSILQTTLTDGMPDMACGSGTAEPTAPDYPELDALFEYDHENAFVVWDNTTTGSQNLYVKCADTWVGFIPFSTGSPADPSGTLRPTLVATAPSGWLLADGSAVSMTTYLSLLTALSDGNDVVAFYGAPVDSTITVDAGTDSILWVGHGLANGTVVQFTSSVTLPAGMSNNVSYYVVAANVNDFQISLTPSGLVVDITDTGTGTHSAYTEYNLPDLRGRGFAGLDNMGGVSANIVTDAAADALGGEMGTESHTLTEPEMASHNHGVKGYTTASAPLGGAQGVEHSGQPVNWATQSTGSDVAHNNMQPTAFGNWLIKT